MTETAPLKANDHINPSIRPKQAVPDPSKVRIEGNYSAMDEDICCPLTRVQFTLFLAGDVEYVRIESEGVFGVFRLHAKVLRTAR